MAITQPSYPTTTSDLVTHVGTYADGLSVAASAPRVVNTSLTTNLGATKTITFSGAEDVWLVGTLNANLAVTTASRAQGSRLVILAVQDATGSRTLTIDGQAVSIPTTASTGLAVVVLRCPDATNTAIETNGVESDPNAVLKSLGTTKGDLVAWTASGAVARQAAGTDGYALIADTSQTNGVKYAARPIVTVAYKTGTLTTATGASRLPIMEAAAIIDVRTMVGTAPTGATVLVDVNKNGTTVFTTQGNRPSIAISGFASSAAVPDVTSLAAGDYLTVDVDQIGSTIAGADLTVAIRYRPTA